MITRFVPDILTGKFTRFVAGKQVASDQNNVLTMQDVLHCEVVIMAGTEDVTATVVPEGYDLRLGLRKYTSIGPSLALSDPHTIEDGVAKLKWHLNTQEVKDLVEEIESDTAKGVPVWWEAQVSKTVDGEVIARDTLAQVPITLRCEGIMDGDEPPHAAQESALTAAAHAAEAARQVGLAAAKVQETADAGAAQVQLAAQQVGLAQQKVADAAAQVGLATNEANRAKTEADRAAAAANAATGGMIPATEKGVAGGVATLGADGKVLLTQLAGVATLDGNGKVPTAQLTPDASKANLDSPELTGTPKATTPGVADDSTRIATTAHVKAVVAAGSSKGADVQTFLANGVWNKPAGAKSVTVIVVGAGGGGGSGYRSGVNSYRGGGGGGAGGAGVQMTFPASMLGNTENVVVGAAGAGAAAAITDYTGGFAGTAGGASSFGALISCGGGAGGSAGTYGQNMPSAGGKLDELDSIHNGGNGGYATASYLNQGIAALFGGGGGGAGAAMTDTNDVLNGTNGGFGGKGGTVINGAADGVDGTPGPVGFGYAGSGGGGGGVHAGGGAGGFPGGGGGGGGCSTTGGPVARAGGNGGAGQVIVITHF